MKKLWEMSLVELERELGLAENMKAVFNEGGDEWTVYQVRANKVAEEIRRLQLKQALKGVSG